MKMSSVAFSGFSGEHSDTQWLQASLPIKDDGLGVERVSSVALPGFSGEHSISPNPNY